MRFLESCLYFSRSTNPIQALLTLKSQYFFCNMVFFKRTGSSCSCSSFILKRRHARQKKLNTVALLWLSVRNSSSVWPLISRCGISYNFCKCVCVCVCVCERERERERETNIWPQLVPAVVSSCRIMNSPSLSVSLLFLFCHSVMTLFSLSFYWVFFVLFFFLVSFLCVFTARLAI